jgi:hypothetical protein
MENPEVAEFRTMLKGLLHAGSAEGNRMVHMNTTQVSSGVVDTGKVAERRVLQFESIDEMLAEVDRLVAAERAGKLKRLGNWTLGQALGHLACWGECAYTGSPLKVPFFIKWILRMRKQKFLYGPMLAGVKIPGVKGGPWRPISCRWRKR